MGQILGKRYKKTKKKKNPNATSKKLGAKGGYYACPLYSMSPAEWAQHLSPSSNSTPGHTPTLTHIRNKPAPSGSEQARDAVVHFHSLPAIAGAPVGLA